MSRRSSRCCTKWSTNPPKTGPPTHKRNDRHGSNRIPGNKHIQIPSHPRYLSCHPNCWSTHWPPERHHPHNPSKPSHPYQKRNTHRMLPSKSANRSNYLANKLPPIAPMAARRTRVVCRLSQELHHYAHTIHDSAQPHEENTNQTSMAHPIARIPNHK